MRSNLIRGACAAAALLSINTALAQPALTYRGDSVVRVFARTPAELEQTLKLTDDVWSHDVGLGPIDIRVSADQLQQLQAAGLTYHTLIEDVEARIVSLSAARGLAGQPPFEDFADLAGIVAHMNGLAAARPDLCTVVSIGNSLEGRPITMIQVHAPGVVPGDRPAVFYNGCQHAREWVTPPAVLYMADRLVNEYDTNPAVPALLSRVSFYIVPVANPDGYVYTWTTQRLWRKNRRNNGGSFGVDLNRNWGFQWGGQGASASPSDDTYRGPSAFSEPETQRLRDYIQSRPEIVGYIDFHCYSQLTLWPWAYTDVLPPDQDLYLDIGTGMRDAILSASGTLHVIGPTFDTIYPASGAASDWTYGARNIFSYAFELRDQGLNGFLLPADQILATCQENQRAGLLLADRLTAPVRFEFSGGVPFSFAPGQSNLLTVSVLDNTQNVAAGTPMLCYRFDAGDPFTCVSLTPIGGDQYQATLPPRPCGTTIEFYVTAEGDQGTVNTDPLGAPFAAHSVRVAEHQLALNDNFESDLGWTVDGNTNSTGRWIRVNPNGTTDNGAIAQPEDDNPAGSGTQCYVTGQGTAGGSVGAADVDVGPTRLTSPLLDLSGYEARVSYWRWYYSNTFDETLDVEISNNGGASWTFLERATNGPEWVKREFVVSDYIAPTNQMRIRFTAQDNPNNGITEAAIDDVRIEAIRCTLILGDMNSSGAVESADLPDFVDVLLGINTAPDSILRADMNVSGIADADDIAAFVDALF